VIQRQERLEKMLIERNETLLDMLRSTNLTFRVETINYL
jgi:hypothetical protein